MSLSPHPIETALKTLAAKAENSIEQTTTLEDLEQLRVNYLGKKGELSQILREMGKLSPEERPRLGAIALMLAHGQPVTPELQRAPLCFHDTQGLAGGVHGLQRLGRHLAGSIRSREAPPERESVRTHA